MLHKNPKPYLIATRFRWDADFFFWENKYFLFILLTFPSASLWRLRGMSDNKRANSLRFFMPGEMWLHTTHHTMPSYWGRNILWCLWRNKNFFFSFHLNHLHSNCNLQGSQTCRNVLTKSDKEAGLADTLFIVCYYVRC